MLPKTGFWAANGIIEEKNLANFLPLGGSEIKTNHPRYWHCRSKGIEITDLLSGYNFNNKGKQIWFLKKFISHLWQAISPLAYST